MASGTVQGWFCPGAFPCLLLEVHPCSGTGLWEGWCRIGELGWVTLEHLLDLVLSILWNLVPNSSHPSWGALGVTPPQISLPAGHTQGDPRSSSLDVVNHLLGKPLTPPRFPPCPFPSAPSSSQTGRLWALPLWPSPSSFSPCFQHSWWDEGEQHSRGAPSSPQPPVPTPQALVVLPWQFPSRDPRRVLLPGWGCGSEPGQPCVHITLATFR